MPNKELSWQPPEYTAKGSTIAGWVSEIVQDGERWVQGQSAFKDIQKGFDLISGQPAQDANESRSKLNTNRAKRSIREIVAALSDTRQVDGFSSDNKAYSAEAEMLNRVQKAIYYENMFDRAMKQTVQWFAVTGSGWQWPVYRNRRMGPKSPRGLYIDTFGALDVLPFMVPNDGDMQGCYAQTIIKMVPVPHAHQMFPTFQHKLQPISKRRYSSTVAQARVPLWQRFARGDRGSALGWEKNYCELRYTLVRDMRINATGILLPMGTPGGSESYLVPSVGMEIPSHETAGGVRVMRQASPEDCYFYPHMRLIITSDSVDDALYDGPNFDWSGNFPARFSADDWPWEKMGYSLIRDIYEIERARQFSERSIDQVSRARMDPGMAYDRTKIPTKTGESFDPWKERGRLGVEGEVDEKTFRTILPESMLNVPDYVFEWLKHLEEGEDYMLGLNAISSLAKAKMGVGGDAMEKLLELAGPLVKDISHSMEPPVRETMETTKYNILQRYDTARIMQYVGPDGVTLVTFDFDPMSLVPSHMPGEDTGAPSAFQRFERARHFAENLRLTITPNSLHAITQTAQKLLYLQLWRSGFPISPVTVAKALDLENWGTVDGNTQFEQWKNYKKEELEFAAQMKELGSSLLPPGQAPAGAGPAGGPKGKGGRPPSGKKPPTAHVKGSAEGPRAVVSES